MVSIQNTSREDIDQDRWKDFATKYNDINNKARSMPLSSQTQVLKNTLVQISGMLNKIKPAKPTGTTMPHDYTGDVGRETADTTRYIQQHGTVPHMT